MNYYLCFKVNRVPDLTMPKYKVFDISGQEDLIAKHEVFLRQLHRMGVESNVFFHLLYFYDGAEGVSKGKRLQIIFYATAQSPEKLELIREFVTTSVLSTYYDFYCYEISNSLEYSLSQGYLQFINLSGTKRKYRLSNSISPSDYDKIRKQVSADGYLFCSVEPGSNEVTEINSDSFYLDNHGRIGCDYTFEHGSYLTKKDYHLYALNRLYNDPQNELIPIYSIMEWLPNEVGRLYNVLKLMEGYNETAALRIDLFSVDVAEAFNDNMAPTINELRQRMSQHDQGRDDNCDTVMKSIEDITKKNMKYPQFFANVIAFSDHKDISVMLVDSVGAEAVESGSYLVKDLSTFNPKANSYEIYSYDSEVVVDRTTYNQNGNYMSEYVSLYTLDEIRPMFSFPVLYPGETIEIAKETDPEFEDAGKNTLFLGMTESGYAVNFPIKLLKKHAFIAGVPGAGKTNTMLYLVTELWNRFGIPFLVLEPAKQEYRALAKISKLNGNEAMREISIFSPGADSKFPLHINPFEFPQGLTLAEHIANLNAVFAGAFELPPPSPHFIDTCIEQVYLEKGWNINSRNDGTLPYPTMQELFDSLNVAVQNSHYEGETLGNLRSVMEVRVGSLLKREIGNVYNVEMSSFKPEEWIERPVIIELEALGEGPANFMTLLISTLIRETLKIKKLKSAQDTDSVVKKRGINHVIFYEEAHNLIGPTQENIGDKVDPKVSATKFLVKMLAEVRALDEGIVIADQLPTVMAPEVLKNTGLKIGHRITASDDRELLGSTMCASPDQLAEQSVFMPGEALVFYEGILKPFKMSIGKWQKSTEEYCQSASDELIDYLRIGVPEDENVQDSDLIGAYFDSVYDSPSDAELYGIIKDYPVYKDLLSRSKNIILQRVVSAYSSLYAQFGDLNKNHIVPSFVEGKKWIEKIQRYKRSYLSAPNRSDVLVDINQMESQFTNPKSVFMDLYTIKDEKRITVDKKLSNLVTECNHLFFNNISIVNNYESHAFEMSARIIEAYLHIFECIDYTYLWGNKSVENLLEKTELVRKAIALYVNYESAEPDGALSKTEFYAPLRERCYAMRGLEIVDGFNKLHKKLIDAIDWQNQKFDQDLITEIANDYSKTYFDWMKVADGYSENKPVLQALIISKYCELFEGLKYFKQTDLLAHFMHESVRKVSEDVAKYVSWKKDTTAELSGVKDYDRIVSLCKGFTRIEINEIFYSEARSKLNDTLAEVNNVYGHLTVDQVTDICRNYQNAYYKCFDICCEYADKDLFADNIELFYSIIIELGMKLKGSYRVYLNSSIKDTCVAIKDVRTRYFDNVSRDSWKTVDSYLSR